MPPDSSIDAITLHLTKRIEAGESLELVAYINGNTTPVSYLTMTAANDLGRSSKREALVVPTVDNFVLGVIYKHADGATTAPPVAYAEVEPSTNQ